MHLDGGALFLTMIGLVIICVIRGVVPFGDQSMASMDGTIQYLDFFLYYKQVLSGNAPIGYTFSTYLGGDTFGLFAYYLSSPFNLLLMLFPEEQMPLCFTIIACLKLMLAAGLMSFYLSRRFHMERNRLVICIALGVAYGLSQYGAAQASNIMWLDGMYMLPIVMLGVYRVVEGRKVWLLAVSLGLTIIFNWYAGGMVALFACAWFCVEMLISQVSLRGYDVRRRLDIIIRTLAWFIVAMVLGVALSCIIFLPTVLAMSGSAKGPESLGAMRMISHHVRSKSFLCIVAAVALLCVCAVIAFRLWQKGHKKPSLIVAASASAVVLIGLFAVVIWSIKNPENGMRQFLGYLAFQYDPWVLPGGYAIGGKSGDDRVSLYCGVLPLIGCLGALFASNAAPSKRIATAIGGMVMLLIVCWRPLYFAFSLLQPVSSYWVRHAFVVEAAMIALSGWYLLARESGFGEKAHARPLIVSVAVFAILQTVSTLFLGERSSGNLLATLIVEVIMLALILGYTFKVQAKHIILAAMAALAVGDSTASAKEAFILYPNVAEFADYYQQNRIALDAIEAADPSDDYRIAQTTNRHGEANQNESLSFGYRAVAGYSSAANGSQIELLVRLGMRQTSVATCYISEILTIDSLFGVKYVLSPYPIKGLIEQRDLPMGGDKVTYENPYALPIAFVMPDDSDMLEDDSESNPFEYTNAVYSRLFGERIELYSPPEVAISETMAASEEGDSPLAKITYDIAVPQGDFALCCILPPVIGDVDVNGVYEIELKHWISPRFLNVPFAEGTDTAYVTLSTESEVKAEDAQIYILDLEKLEKVATAAESRSAYLDVWEDGYVRMHATASQGESLFVSIPQQEGWSVLVNGRPVECGKCFGCLFSIPLDNGENEIVMQYAGPSMLPGAFVSLVALVSVIGISLIQNKRDTLLRAKD